MTRDKQSHPTYKSRVVDSQALKPYWTQSLCNVLCINKLDNFYFNNLWETGSDPRNFCAS